MSSNEPRQRRGRESSPLRRGLVAIFGGLVLLVGVIAIPYPGPGWLIVFAGLGILGTEFNWARHILVMLRKRYDKWQDWYKSQSILVKTLFASFTLVVVVATIYVLNGYGILNSLLNLNLPWLKSPLL